MSMKLSDLDPASAAECKLAIKWGWHPIPDTNRGRGWYKFIKNQLTIYRIKDRNIWMSMKMLDGRYLGHIEHVNLADAIHREE